MRKATVLFLVALFVSAGMAISATKTYRMKVEGLKCEKCVGAVDKALKKLEGVTLKDSNLEKKEIVVAIDAEKVNLDTVKKTIAEAGYKVVEVKEAKAEKDSSR